MCWARRVGFNGDWSKLPKRLPLFFASSVINIYIIIFYFPQRQCKESFLLPFAVPSFVLSPANVIFPMDSSVSSFRFLSCVCLDFFLSFKKKLPCRDEDWDGEKFNNFLENKKISLMKSHGGGQKWSETRDECRAWTGGGHYGTKPGHCETSKNALSHELGGE